MYDKEQQMKAQQDLTYNNPGCYHDALQYASKKTGIPLRKDIFFDTLSQLYQKNKAGKTKLRFKSYNIYVIDEKGKEMQFWEGNQRFDQRGIVANKFRVNVGRTLDEFGLEIKSAGKYKDSLGGGWYSDVERFSIDDKYFAIMDCTC